MNISLKFLLTTPIIALSQVVAPSDSATHAAPKKAPAPDKALKFNLSEDGSRWFQVTFMNQTWARYTQSNDGTTVKNKSASETFDIGLRRTRIQMYGQITDRAFLYFQFGQNNFNYLSQIAGNRKIAAFFHDAVCEYRVSSKNQLKVGGGLTIANGLSRFSQPSVGTIATLDVPVFAQATVDQIDLFSRKLSLYARGQVGKFDYRFSLSDPFPVSTSSLTGTQAAPAITKNVAVFADSGHHKQLQGYLMYQFFEHEGHTTPYMTGTYLGTKKVFNVAAGAIYQSKATVYQNDNGNTVYNDLKLFCVESFLDMPLNKEKQTAINAYVGYFNTNYGKNYLRFNGIMNPADGIKGTNVIAGTQGNAYPMMGTGQVVYMQLAYVLPKNWFGDDNTSRVSVYASDMINKFDRVGTTGAVHTLGFNWFINGHKAKISAEVQNRPTYLLDPANAPTLKFNNRKSCINVQYQIFI